MTGRAAEHGQGRAEVRDLLMWVSPFFMPEIAQGEQHAQLAEAAKFTNKLFHSSKPDFSRGH